jgi:hypothetical protein
MMDTDRNLLFGVLALQADLLDPPRFAEVCAAWAARLDPGAGDHPAGSRPVSDLRRPRGQGASSRISAS